MLHENGVTDVTKILQFFRGIIYIYQYNNNNNNIYVTVTRVFDHIYKSGIPREGLRLAIPFFYIV